MIASREVRSPLFVVLSLFVVVALAVPLAGCGSSASAATAEPPASAVSAGQDAVQTQPAQSQAAADQPVQNQPAPAQPVQGQPSAGQSAPAQSDQSQPSAGAAAATQAAESQGAASQPPAGAAQDTAAAAAADTRPLLERTNNILLLGSDRRPGTPNWRTDVMMIIAIDNDNQRVGVISLPRDIYVDSIPGYAGTKINVIDYMGEQDHPNGGGPKLLAAVMKDKLGIPIDHYIRFDFEAFKKLVDAMGGVDVEIDCPLYDPYGYDQGGLPLALDAGTHRLNGGQALSYVRSRRVGGDLERDRRQQRFAWAVRSQILKENLLPRVPAMYAALNDSVQTDLTLIDALNLVRFSLGIKSQDVHGFVINDPSMIKEGYAGPMWVWYPNWKKIAEAAQKVFDGKPLFEANTKDGTQKCP